MPTPLAFLRGARIMGRFNIDLLIAMVYEKA
jgi:hypothetical protein